MTIQAIKPKTALIGALCATALLTGCAITESSRTVPTAPVASYNIDYSGNKSPLAVGRFANTSAFMRGIFADGDKLGNQAKTILITHLSQTNRFIVMDRANTDQLSNENKLAGKQAATQGADLIITGDVTEFGRRTTGDHQLFGLFGRGKQQVAFSKVSINVVDVATSRIIYSVQGAGEFALDNREVFGTGTTASYDSTLNAKVLNLSITDAVNKLVSDLDAGRWNPTLATR